MGPQPDVKDKNKPNAWKDPHRALGPNIICHLPDRQERETGVVGKQVLATRREHWPIGNVITAYCSSSTPNAASTSSETATLCPSRPMRHWTGQAARGGLTRPCPTAISRSLKWAGLRRSYIRHPQASPGA